MSQTTNDKVWLITGCSSGFGRVLAEAAIEHGDRVVATARSVERLKDLAQRCGLRMLILPLDAKFENFRREIEAWREKIDATDFHTE
jgi:NADP-dependent 3-hydroxy acid dehydrogenase YdfG